MALITCPECGKQISDQSPACIHCGYPLPQKTPAAEVSLPNADPQTKAEAEAEAKAQAEEKTPEKPKEQKTGKGGKVFAYILLTVFLVGVVSMLIGIFLPEESPYYNFFYMLFLLCVLVFILCMLGYAIATNDTSEEERKKQKEEQRLREVDGYVSGPLIDYTKILYTQIVSQEDKRSLGSAVVRGAVGGVVAGPVGAAAGVVTAKGRGTTTFLVVTRPQEKNIVTVKNNGTAFNMFCKHLK